MASAGDVGPQPGHPLVPTEPPPPIPSPLQQRYQRQRQHQHQEQQQSKAEQSVSRYRALRGKSVSSIHLNENGAKAKAIANSRTKTFGVFSDVEDVRLENHPALRRRSKSSAPTSPKQQRPGSSAAHHLQEPTATANATANANANANENAKGNLGLENGHGHEHGHGHAKANATAKVNAIASPAPLTSKSVNANLPSAQPSSTDLSTNLSVKTKLENTRPADLARLKTLGKRSSKENLEVITPTKAPKPILKAVVTEATATATAKTKAKAKAKTKEDEAEHWAAEVARLEAETDRILAEQKKRDLARLQAQLAAPAPAPATPKPRPKRLILDKLTFLTKGSRSNASSPATPTRTSPRSYPLIWSPGTTNFDGAISPDTMAFIEHGGAGGLVPQIDAPTSASNGGERRVTVRCESATINLPVTSETSPTDIIYSTANLVSHRVDPSNCVLIEGYVMFGLERRLRKYEKIRDVMNSWDRDQQNSLVVMPYDSPPDDRDLDLAHVPRTDDPPIGFTFQLYHSSRPGKWNKRWVTLMDTGQIFAAKHPDSKFTDKDSTALCHLSDFDIYTPRESETRRHLKAPKRFCYAIKSQQKTNVFPNGENWVHFFSTDDSKLAQRFHELIHGWRSWYLANKKVDLHERAASTRTSADTLKKSMSVSQKSHQSRQPEDQKPYLIGEFKPLIDMERFDKALEEFGKDLPIQVPPPEPETKELPQRTKTVSRTPTKTQNKNSASVPTSPRSNESEFLSGSLLGDNYEKRKQAETAPTLVKKIEGPFTEGPSLLNNGLSSGAKAPAPAVQKPEPQSWFPSAVEHTARQHNVASVRGSQRRPMTADNASSHHRYQQQPLLGYGHNNAQPPLPGTRGAFRGPGNGRGVRAPANGGPLIDLANGNPMPSAPFPRSNTRSSIAPVPGAGGLVNQPRRRATTTTTSSRSGQPLVSGIRPPVPPLPDRSQRHPDSRVVSSASSGRGQRPAEPLINRVR